MKNNTTNNLEKVDLSKANPFRKYITKNRELVGKCTKYINYLKFRLYICIYNSSVFLTVDVKKCPRISTNLFEFHEFLFLLII